jgi:protein disulfide-isomerase
MKNIFVAALFLLSAYAVQAQELVWQTNIDKAVEISNKTKKPMLILFTGSDWCGPCMRLHKEVFDTPEFAKWSKENVVLVKLDFLRRTQQAPEIVNQNAKYQELFNARYFPTIFYANATLKKGNLNFNVLGSTVSYAPNTDWFASADKILKKK